MIPREAAIQTAASAFPYGPETLARELDIHVVRTPLAGAEGWCVRGVQTVIRINSNAAESSQRFTLAHELAHLILGTQPDVAAEPLRSDLKEERAADQLASELLIPAAKLAQHIQGQVLIEAKSLSRLAAAAKVSPVVAAFRVVNATSQLGLQNAAIVFFTSGRQQWRYSNGLQFSQADAESLLREAFANKPNPARCRGEDGNVAIASILETHRYQVLLIQLLPEETASQETREEQLRRLADEVFGADKSFRQSVAGCLGTVKGKFAGTDIAGALQFFNQKYVGTKYVGANAAKLLSPNGQSYLRIYLQNWFR